MEKYTYKDSGIEWLGDIPEHWKVDRLKDKTLSVVGGDWGNDVDSNKEGVDIIVLRVADLDGVYFSYDNKTVRKIKEGSYRSRKITDRSLIIEKSGGGEKQLVGRVGFAKGLNFDAICSNFMANITLDNSVDLNFINYLFSTLYSSKLNFPFVQQTTGIQNLNVTYYLNTKVAFPTFQEQKAIAEYLDKATTKIDRIIAIKQKQLEKMEESFFSKLDNILTCSENSIQNSQNHTGFINRYIPNDWKIDRLRDVAIINENKLSNKTNPDFILNYIDIGNVNKYGIIDKEAIEEISFEEAPSRARRITKMQDTIISSVRTNLQAVAFIDFEIKNLISSTGFFVCRPKYNEHLRPKFLYYFLLTVYSRDFFFSNSMGVSYPAINDYRFGSIYIFIPPPDTQDDIVDKLDTLRDTIQESQDNLKSQIEALQEYRKSLIHECVTGKKQIASAIKEQTYA